MFGVVALPPIATIGAAAIIAIAAASILAFRNQRELNLTSFAFWQALVGAGLNVVASSKQKSAARAAEKAEEARALADKEAAAKASAEARLLQAKAQTTAPRTGSGFGCAFLLVLLLSGLTFAVLAAF